MTKFLDDYRQKYDAMRAAATNITGPLLRDLVMACQQNPWLKVGGIEFEDDFLSESDYDYSLWEFQDIAQLRYFFEHGNWAIRNAVKFRDLIFVNQVNGGDEWWTLKITGNGRLLPFESLSCQRIIERGKSQFEDMIERMVKATPKACKSLNY